MNERLTTRLKIADEHKSTFLNSAFVAALAIENELYTQGGAPMPGPSKARVIRHATCAVPVCALATLRIRHVHAVMRGTRARLGTEPTGSNIV